MARNNPFGALGAAIVVSMTALVVFGPIFYEANPLTQTQQARLLPPLSPQHPLGTDSFGRDMLARALHGGRVTLGLSVAALTLSGMLGFAIGVISGYLGGRFDLILQRFVDALLAFPALILAIGFVAVLGQGVGSVLVAIAVVFVARISRVARATALVIREMPYIEAAQAIGAGPGRIIVHHMSSNVLNTVIVLSSAFLGQAMLLEATMSFLGLGVALPNPSWGNLLAGEARQYFFSSPHLVLIPGLALSVTVFGFNVMGDAIADFNNPRLGRSQDAAAAGADKEP